MRIDTSAVLSAPYTTPFFTGFAKVAWGSLQTDLSVDELTRTDFEWTTSYEERPSRVPDALVTAKERVRFLSEKPVTTFLTRKELRNFNEVPDDDETV